MPRTARKNSPLDLYHVILRATNKEFIFKDQSDFKSFLSILSYSKQSFQFSIHAYCIMHNHVHLLIGNTDGKLGDIMKQIEVTFVKWYNKKYNRCGHLFQNRYKCEVICDDTYFLCVLRYIHQNPLHAGLETQVGAYPWSSFYEYRQLSGSLTDLDKACGYFTSHRELMSFLETDQKALCMEYESYNTYSDEKVKKLFFSYSNCRDASDLCHMDNTQLEENIYIFLQAGFTVRQLSRATNISNKKIAQIRDAFEAKANLGKR